AEVSDTEVDEALERLGAQNRPFVSKGDGEAKLGDRVTISFVGSIDGTPFEGGTGDDVPVVIGSKSFIPGFEEQLAGIKAGEQRTITAPFPQNYMKAELAGKDASFAVTAKTVEAPGEVKLDDEFAKQLGMESLAKLREAIKARIAQEHTGAS